MTLEKLCLHKLNGECKDGLTDYDERHHPNNYDCKDYVPIDILEIEVRNTRRKK